MNYKRIHDQIINRAKKRVLEGYKEKHHIVPKSMGGGNEQENIIELTAREHFIIHQLLVKIYPDAGKLKSALWFMCNQKGKGRDYKVSSRVYEQAKLDHITQITGVLKSEQTKAKIATTKKGVPNLKNRGRKRPDLTERNVKRKGIKKPRKSGYKHPKKGIPQTQELITKRAESRKMNGKPILRYDKNMNLKSEYRCLTDAKEWLLQNVGKGDIIANLKGSTKSAGGFIWKYKEI